MSNHFEALFVFNDEQKLFQKLAPHLQKVLVVDAQPAPVKMLQELLRTISNGQVWHAPTDAKAMQAVQMVDPQIIFLEHSGPGLDGARLARAIRRSDFACRKVPIIMVTSEATAQTILSARDAGVHEFLRKPYTMKDLLRRLEAVALKPRDWVEAVQYVGPDRRRFNSAEYQGPKKRKTDSRMTPDQAKLLQALKIVRAAAGALDSDWIQARRALATQAMELQKAGVAVGDMRLVQAAAAMAKLLPTEGAPDKAGLRAAIGALLTFLPKDLDAGAARAA